MAGEIDRYDMVTDIDGAVEPNLFQDGEWVRYQDHADTIAALQAEMEDASYKADYWKRMHDELSARLTALEQENKRLREIVERAFRDGFHSGAYVVTTPDYAWEIAKVRADLAALTHEDKT